MALHRETAILRVFVANVAKAPEVGEEAKKTRMEVEYIPAEECLKSLDYLLNQPDDIVKEFSNTITF